MPDSPQNLVIKTLAKGATAELREIVENCDDRETARPIYTELLRLAHKLSHKFEFQLTKKCENRAGRV
jgi:hypothetical protein